VFSATEAYLIEDGKVTAPVKGATLIGNGPETMQRVSMVGNDLAPGRRRGHLRQGRAERAGRAWASPLLISEMTVGGTQA
jgi:TldD protein